MINPIGSVKNRNDFVKVLQGKQLLKNQTIENNLMTSVASEEFTVDGICIPCNKKVPFLVDKHFGGLDHSKGWTPNWRERLECPHCRMNNRQRLIATLLKQELFETQEKKCI